MVRDGLAKMVMLLKVGAECEEGGSGAKIWERVVQPVEAASVKALWHKELCVSSRKKADLAEEK